MNALRFPKSRREPPRFRRESCRRRSPRLESLEDRRLLSLTWNSTKLIALSIDFGATVTPNGQFFVSDGLQIERSVDQGATWKPVTPLALTPVGSIAYAPSNPKTMLAGRSAGGILKSVDGGSNWMRETAFLRGGTVTAIAFDPKNENTVYAGVGNGSGGLYKSTTGGATWSNSLLSRDVRAVALDPGNSNVLYAGVHVFSTDSGGLLKSSDGGSTWQTVLPDLDVLSVLVDPANAQRIYAGTRDKGIYMSSAGGAAGSWTQVTKSTIVSPVTAMAFDPQSSAHVLAATGGRGIGGQGQGIFSSTDSGASWSADNTGLTDLSVAAMAVQTASPHQVLVVTFGGKGFWTTLPQINTPAPPIPRPGPIPIPSPVSRPQPPTNLLPVRTTTPGPVVLLPSPSTDVVTPIPAPSPTRPAHKRKGHRVVRGPKAHQHPAITHHQPKATQHGKRSPQGPRRAAVDPIPG